MGQRKILGRRKQKLLGAEIDGSLNFLFICFVAVYDSGKAFVCISRIA